VNFKVYEYETELPLDFWFSENFGQENGQVNVGESIILLYKNKPTDARYQRAWSLKFNEPLDDQGLPVPAERWVSPQHGDKYLVINKIPFSARDTYRYQTFKGKRLEGVQESVLNKIRVVPNPYVVSSILERQPYLRGRGERIIRFINLPSQCTIRIYTVNGDLVNTLEHSGIEDGAVVWDLRTKDGLEVAFGLYVYHVDAPRIGEHIGKFSIIN